MTVPSPSPHTSLVLDAEALYAELRRGVQALLQPHTQLVGIASGGAWLAERLHRDLGLAQPHSSLSSSLHRDDFAQRGLSRAEQTSLPFAVDGSHILLLDDVLHTGRSIRAALNEIFDFGRPASVQLAVLVDRGGRELPIEATVAAARMQLPDTQSLTLQQDSNDRFSFCLRTRSSDDAAPLPAH